VPTQRLLPLLSEVLQRSWRQVPRAGVRSPVRCAGTKPRPVSASSVWWIASAPTHSSGWVQMPLVVLPYAVTLLAGKLLRDAL